MFTFEIYQTHIFTILKEAIGENFHDLFGFDNHLTHNSSITNI